MSEPALARIEVPREAGVLAEELAQAGGGHVRAVLMYGSHLTGAAPGPHSAYDMVVIVESYRGFYRALAAAGAMRRPAPMMAGLSMILPPNTLAFAPEGGDRGIAKCLVVRDDHFERALGPRPHDHFLLGRLVQRVALAWSADDAAARWVQNVVDRARAGVLEWMAPWIEEPFDAETLGRRLLEVCYQGEIRPESGDRALALHAAQADHFREALTPGIEAWAAAGRLLPDDGRYRLARAASDRDRAHGRRYFLRSKVRSTTRWAKHVLTFENWLPYIVRKVERRTGQRVELTRLERRLPLLFLWPRVVRVLRARPDTEDTP